MPRCRPEHDLSGHGRACEKTPKLEIFITIADVSGVSADMLLADVVNAQYEIKSSELMDKMAIPEPRERDAEIDTPI